MTSLLQMLVLLTYSDVIHGFFLSDPAKHSAIGDLHPIETLQGHRRSVMVCVSIHFMIDVVKMCNGSHAAFDKVMLGKF